MRIMTDTELTEAVVRSFADTPHPRLREILTSLVRHLHAFAAEVRLTEAEWLAGIRFLTQVGQACTNTRQETILLSDTLGLSSLVDLLSHRRPAGATESTILGPFYVPGSPERELGESMVEAGGGEPALVSGRVTTLDGTPIEGARLDVWQADGSGVYAVQDPGRPRDNLRGVFRTDGDGAYRFWTTRPVSYQIPPRRPGRQDAGGDRAPPVAGGAHPRDRQRGRL